MIDIFRFSEDGFTGKEQSYHYNLLLEFQKPLDTSGMNDWQKSLVHDAFEKSKPLFAKLNLDDWKEGVFAFISELPKPHWIKQELNHLKQQQLVKRKLFKAKISTDALIYSPYGLIPEGFNANHYLKRYFPGAACFIPKRSLDKIFEIQCFGKVPV